MRREARQKVVWQGWRSAESNVPHGGVTCRFGLLSPRPISVRIARGGIHEL